MQVLMFRGQMRHDSVTSAELHSGLGSAIMVVSWLTMLTPNVISRFWLEILFLSYYMNMFLYEYFFQLLMWWMWKLFLIKVTKVCYCNWLPLIQQVEYNICLIAVSRNICSERWILFFSWPVLCMVVVVMVELKITIILIHRSEELENVNGNV